ncbi:GTPase SAR1 family protein [Natronobacillus azotifigens]|uniref:Uncharacterized protein n=1 Tax=Natronobacillus azotifigens TaxID=472978 RepID=A0A9J6RG48_9BACI|nr:hypothetical protein [Natronobacillus azotifigens]MCZ0704406.1 hypothetical protein [Natronobacillus azotifigens]
MLLSFSNVLSASEVDNKIELQAKEQILKSLEQYSTKITTDLEILEEVLEKEFTRFSENNTGTLNSRNKSMSKNEYIKKSKIQVQIFEEIN